MKNKLFSGKTTRTKIFTVITLLCVVLLLALNLFAYNFSVFGTAYIDMTPEGLYTLRPEMVEACRDILMNEDGTLKDQGIKITFCDDPDNLISDTITRAVYYMAVALSQKYSNFEVDTVNIKYNPTAVSMYKTTSLTEITSKDVIISYGSRYRIASADTFWRIQEDSTVYSYDGEYKLASIMMSLTMINKPSAYFITDHGTSYYDPEKPESEASAENGYFVDLLYEKGFEIKTLSLAQIIDEASEKEQAPRIPDDCLLLILNDPKEDFESDKSQYGSFSYVSELELLDRFMTEGTGSLMVAKDYRRELPELEDFLSEWGIEYSNTLVKDENNCITVEGVEEGTQIVGVYETDESSYAYGIYGEYANLTTAPKMIVSDSGHIRCSYDDATATSETGTYNTTRVFVPFLYSSADAMDYGKNSDTGKYVDQASQENEARTLAALCTRKQLDSDTGYSTYSYLFAAASAHFFSSELLGNASYANYDIMSALIQDITRLDTYADSSLGGESLNNLQNFAGKILVEVKIGEESRSVYRYREDGKSELVRTVYGLKTNMKIVYTVIIAVIPLICTVLGIIVCVKRKYK